MFNCGFDSRYPLMKYVECSCKADQPYADGTFPRFHTNEDKAHFDYEKHLRRMPLHWGIHLNGLHIIGGKIRR